MSNQAYNEIYGSPVDSGSGAGHAPSPNAMLDQMRERLVSLSDEARSIRSQVPHEFGPDVERIQQQMQRLGERLSDLGRGALVPYNPAQHVHEQRAKVVRYVTEDDRRVGRAQPNEVIPLGAPGRHNQDDPCPWDESAANALFELYDSGEAYASGARRQTMSSARAMAAVTSRASQRTVYAAASTSGPVSDQQPQGAQCCAMDSNFLDQRFAEIAARIEESLAQIRPEAALASLGSRFDQLETQINAMLGQVATRADIEELRAAEAQIDEIASQLSQLRRQMARLDLIDAHLGTLTSQLSDERLTRLFNEGVHLNADVGRLDAIDAQLRMIAVQLSDERLCGLVSRSTSRDDYEDVAHAAAQRVASSFANVQQRDADTRDIGEVRGMLESLINERRHNDENNASMLETMQQAIIRVLDRIDSLEMAQVAAPAASMAPAMPSPVQPRAVVPAAPAPAVASAPAIPEAYDDLVPPTATIFAEMPQVAEAGEASDFLPMDADADAGIGLESDMQAFEEDAAAERSPPRIPVYTTSSFDLDEAFSRARDAEAAAFGEPQPPAKRSIEVMRHDFIADAHRAKLKAASKPDAATSDLRAGELSVGAGNGPAKPRRRSIFSFRSQRIAMSLLVLLAAVPAAIFFMPRTDAGPRDVTPAAVVAPAPQPGARVPASTAPAGEAPAIVPSLPNAAPPAIEPPSKQTQQIGPDGEQQNKYEDASAADAQIDTASLPDGITMQDGVADGPHLAQASQQARLAYLSGQVGIAAAKATPAALMEEQVLRANGSAPADASAPANGGSRLPPATVGPFSLRLAAAQGDASAQFEVASRLAEGKGTDQDLKEAADWYQRAASNGFAMAQFRLGTLYERGLGVKVDRQRAKVWYERAATQGNVKAMHNLAVLTASATPKADYKAAVRWFSIAADHGLADSQYNLAVLYENGMGVGKDLQTAYKWLILAAKSGDKDAAARRDAIKAKLSPEQVATADDEASSWQAKPITGMANDARLAGQAWQGASRRG